jgi:hypothetical protein
MVAGDRRHNALIVRLTVNGRPCKVSSRRLGGCSSRSAERLAMQLSYLDSGGITSLQVAEKPIRGQRSDLLKRPWFLEQVGCAGDDLEALFARKQVQC